MLNKGRNWIVADTVRTDRKDIFCFVEGNQHHVGTIVSGSRHYLRRFEQEVSLIRRSPEMKEILRSLVFETQVENLRLKEIKKLAISAQEILNDIEYPYKEG